jgi:cellulose synthase operon protein C
MPTRCSGMARVEEFEGKGDGSLTARGVRLPTRACRVLSVRGTLHLDAERSIRRARRGPRVAPTALRLGPGRCWGARRGSRGFGDLPAGTAAPTSLQPARWTSTCGWPRAAVRQRRYAEAVRLASRRCARQPLGAGAGACWAPTSCASGRWTPDARRWSAPSRSTRSISGTRTRSICSTRCDGFRTVTQGRFEVVAPVDDAELLALYIIPLLERAYDSLSVRYGYQAPTPVRLEFFRSMRTSRCARWGSAGLGALGVSFGSLLAMDTPMRASAARSTGAAPRGTSSRTPSRWAPRRIVCRAGCRRGCPCSRSAAPTPDGVRAPRCRGCWRIARTPAPREPAERRLHAAAYPEETSFSYYHASLFCEWVEVTKGARPCRRCSPPTATGSTHRPPCSRCSGCPWPQVDAQFDAWLKAAFATELRRLAGASRHATAAGGAVRAHHARGGGRWMETAGFGARAARAGARMFPRTPATMGPRGISRGLALEATATPRARWPCSSRSRGATRRPGMPTSSRRSCASSAAILPAPLRPSSACCGSGHTTAGDHEALAMLARSSGDHARRARASRRDRAAPHRPARSALELARALADAGDVAGARRELLAGARGGAELRRCAAAAAGAAQAEDRR